VLRDEIGLTRTKFSCGIAQCGACTVLVDVQPNRSCSYPVGLINGKITTIETTISPNVLSEMQEAWIGGQTPQCSYCQSGQIMSATALLSANPNPTDEDINIAMAGNICRCSTYPRIRAAIPCAWRCSVTLHLPATKLLGKSLKWQVGKDVQALFLYHHSDSFLASAMQWHQSKIVFTNK
jgi:isoquinoline 1-oxidoreductase alpha subunit